ncbi:MAG: serine/threonine-protein kinase [Acidobacteriota bacterium]
MDRDPTSGLDPTDVASDSSGSDDTVPAGPRAKAAEGVPSAARRVARYELGAMLGRGGMGEVVAARDVQIGRLVAIKRMRARGGNPELVARFLREARVQGRLDHPAIVPVHELCDDTEEPYFVMKKLAGVTLGDVIAGGDAARKFSRQQLLRAFVEVCLAIEFAHTRGVVHRDLKPANIMLGDFGEVYVLDWGIARIVGDEASAASFGDIETLEGGGTVAGTLLGTPGYMSPEQARGDADIDARSDVYALGTILFELLAGKPLHPRGHAGLASALGGVDARPSLVAPDREIAPELDTVCARATALERDDRFATARELGDALQRFLDGDRDLALRRELARGELARAREALARGDASADRADALRAAARALALDPHAREPAELVGRLMIEPPADMPAEVEAELAEQERTALYMQARRGGLAMLGYLGFLPLLYIAGIRDGWLLAPIAALVGLTVAARRLLDDHSSRTVMRVSVAANMLIVALIARMTSPFLLAPCVAMVTATVFAMVPRLGRAWALYLGFASAVLVPFALERLGLVRSTIAIDGDSVVLHARAAHLDPFVTLAGLGLFVAVVLAIAIAMARGIANARDRSHRALQLQAWQLRQLVPRA